MRPAINRRGALAHLGIHAVVIAQPMNAPRVRHVRATGWVREDRGSVLVETALGVVLVLSIALPFGALISYATAAARDLAAVQSAARDTSRTRTVVGGDVSFACGSTAATQFDSCVSPLARGTYVAVTKDTAVTLPFGLVFHTNAKAVARVG